MNEILLKEKFKEIADAIRAKKGTTEPIIANDFPAEILSISGGGGYTGHADIEGLKAIGWTDEDIAYYQKHGVNWMEEYDLLHKVPQDNIDLYGVINATNIQTHKANLVYLPKIDTSQVTSFTNMFNSCTSLTSIPLLDTSKSTEFGHMFHGCTSLTSIPLIDTSNGEIFNNMFTNCTSLTTIPLLDISLGVQFSNMLSSCTSLTSIPLLNVSNGTIFYGMFAYCTSLTSIPLLNVRKGTDFDRMFFDCHILSKIKLKGLPMSIDLSYMNQVTINKESLLFIIINSISISKITIKLDANNFNIYSQDADVRAALSTKGYVVLTN